MMRQTKTSLPSTYARSFKLLILLVTVGLLAVPGTSHANQVYKACGKKWVKKARSLQQEQIAWMLAEGTAVMTKDFDGDGTVDTLTVRSGASYRNCDVENMWDKKETTVRVEYGDGKSKIVHWIDDGLVKSLRFYSGQTRFLVLGVDARGATVNRWVDAGRETGPVPPTLVADGESPEEAAEAFKLASIH